MALSNVQKKAVKSVLEKYEHKFDVDEDVIDLRAMAKNFSNGIIPRMAITEITNAILDSKKNGYVHTDERIDPRTAGLVPKFDWVAIEDTSVNPIFQRDLAPNHVAKIEKDFDAQKIIVPCAIRDPRTGQYLIWDGNHTCTVLARHGWTHVPLWYVEVEADEDMDIDAVEKALILQAGRSFLAINKKNKRPVTPYDDHFISYECGEPEAVIIHNIVHAANCQISRSKKPKAGDISHISNLYATYNLTTPMGTKGAYLRRALETHRKTWKHEKINGVTMIALAKVYQHCELQTGTQPDELFDEEIGSKLRELYGPSEIAALEFQEQYADAWSTGRDGIPEQAASAIMLTYNKHFGRINIGAPVATFPVK